MKLLLYCTKSKKQLFFDKIKQMFMFGLNGKNDKFNSLNGKIVAECDFEVEEIETLCLATYFYKTKSLSASELEKRSCLSEYQLQEYFREQNFIGGYAIHIKNLHIFDEPIKLEKCHNDDFSSVVNYAPQNMMYSWLFTDKWNRYILISIRPEHLVNILNGNKTIEIRKKILNKMKE